jgi:hypothetical protein
LLERPAFVRRVFGHSVPALIVMALGWGIGVLGYHWIGGLGWVDSLLNASMIPGGMGPVDPFPPDAAKIFASLDALFSGLAFIGVASVMIAPFIHRLMHRVHLDEA